MTHDEKTEELLGKLDELGGAIQTEVMFMDYDGISLDHCANIDSIVKELDKLSSLLYSLWWDE